MIDAREVSIELGLDEVDDIGALRKAAARKLRRSIDSLPELVVRKRSIDARRGSVRFRLVIAVGASPDLALALPVPREVQAQRRVAIVGDGPAGLFCSYELARHGIASVVIDRGRPVQPRRRDLKALNQRGLVDNDSNYCFGEGGAGTFSDGKLYTRAHKRGRVRDVMEILAKHGAPADILVDARPHIGSNRLPKVVTALRETLQGVGVVFLFESRVVAFDVSPEKNARGVILDDGQEIGADAVVVAAGHSARDVHLLLADAGVTLEPKAFALGVRIEHPQPLINQIQYGRAAGHPRLPAASYRLAQEIEGRGVFSFCMCPGGWIVPAATEPNGLVVNGMSLSRRDSPFANAGLVVAIEPDDVRKAGYAGALGGIGLQRTIEQNAFAAGGGNLAAPATRLNDFLAGRGSSSVGKSSYIPGLLAGDIAEVLDSAGLPLSSSLARGLTAFGSKLRGFLSDEALLVGVETRTSSPVRVPRLPNLQTRDVGDLYPCGEGAGYAGGIVSAALDGMRVAQAIVERWGAA